MADNHVSRLNKIRNDRCSERRALAEQYREANDPIEIVEKLVYLQEQIDVLDRAIADEQRIEKQRSGSKSDTIPLDNLNASNDE
jgi:TolA-binding protein